jgi:site-specific recombinase XerD
VDNRIGTLRVVESPDAWQRAWRGFERSLRADPKVTSKVVDGTLVSKTIDVYRAGGEKFHAFLVEHGFETDPTKIGKSIVEEFIAELRATSKPSTVHTRISGLKRFFGWLEAEGLIERSPVWRIKTPKVADEDTDSTTLKDEEITALLKACEGKAFEDRRDMAIIRLALDSGMRRFEIAGMPYNEDILDQRVYRFTGKGNHTRYVYLGDKVIRDIDRYLREREKHPQAKLSALWLAHKGALTPDGVHHLVRRRAAMAGITRTFGPHALRHTWAHHHKADGTSDENLMRLGGWRDAKSMRRYGNKAADERAEKVARGHSLGDKF